MEKYCLTDNTIYITGNRLYQIKALKDFGKVKKGDLVFGLRCEILHKKTDSAFLPRAHPQLPPSPCCSSGK